LALKPCGRDGQHGNLRNCVGPRLMHNASSECGGFARDPAKVEDQVRLLARTL